MADVDVLRVVIRELAARLDVWVADVLPMPDELDENLPMVVVDEVPGASKLLPWQSDGPELRTLGVDIDVLGRSRAQTRPIREHVDQIMKALPNLDVGITQVKPASTFHTRPDFNQTVRRVGGEYLVIARTE